MYIDDLPYWLKNEVLLLKRNNLRKEKLADTMKKLVREIKNVFR